MLRRVGGGSTLRPEASLVSPHERSLLMRAGGSPSLGRLERIERGDDLGRVPSGFTLGHTMAIRPAGSTRNVVRAVPQYVLP